MGRTGTTLFSNQLEICKKQHWKWWYDFSMSKPAGLPKSWKQQKNDSYKIHKTSNFTLLQCIEIYVSTVSIYMYLPVVSPIVPVLFEDMPNSGFTCLHCTLRQLLSLASPRNHCQSAVEHPRQHSRPPSSRPEKMVDTRWFFYGCICPCYCDVSCYWLLQCSTWNLKRCNEEAHWPRYQVTGF